MLWCLSATTGRLALFVSTMDRMVYDDSEKLGDAYEYLLKTAEAQADAGQFRTPRHIIDFIVKIINPQKHEVIIDPACGDCWFPGVGLSARQEPA